MEYYQNYDIITEYADTDIINNLFTDMIFEKSIISEYETVYSTYTDNEAVSIAKKRLASYMNKLSDKGIVINNKDVKVSIADGVCSTNGYLYLSVPQNKHKVISIDEWRVKDSDEQERNNN